MTQQLQDTANYNHVIFMSHVPPDNEDFDPVLVDDYKQTIRDTKSTILSVNGHRHNFALGQPFNDGIWYLNTSSPGNGYFAYVEIYPNAVAEPKFSCTLIPIPD
jgi:Icc-related predicted phosphoesterase